MKTATKSRTPSRANTTARVTFANQSAVRIAPMPSEPPPPLTLLASLSSRLAELHDRLSAVLGFTQNHADLLLGAIPSGTGASVNPKLEGRLFELGAQIDHAHALVGSIEEQFTRLASL
jgi:hypothetical protein